ncbi:MAG: hypothetical protein Q9216_006406 [Gyalolechia sp. 2 TL-2023]
MSLRKLILSTLQGFDIMGKSKAAQPAKATKAVKEAEVKALSSVKGSAVTKPSQAPKSKSKELAKQVASKSEKGNKKSKKVVKEPTPEPSSDSESDAAMTSASSESSDEESDEEVGATAAKPNGVAKTANAETSDSSESSDSEADAAPLAPTSTKTAKVAVHSDDDSSDGSGSSSGAESDVESEADSSEDDVDVKPGAVDAQLLNGKLEKVASKQVSSAESDDDSSDAASEADSDSDDSSEDDNAEEAAAPSKKRKADTEPTPVAKKAKADAMASSFDDASKGNLFVGNLSWNVDEEWLTREFEGQGEIKSARIVTDRETGRSRGFGYVEFVNPSDGVKAHKALKETMIDGRTINLDFAGAKKEKSAAGGYQERSNKYGDQLNEPSSTIFCANLAFGATEDDVSNAFSEHAPVTAVRIPTDMNTGQAKGFAYVQFSTTEEATTAFEGMKGASINGRSIRIDYASQKPQNGGGGRGGDRGGRGGGRGRGGFDRGGRGGGGRGRGGFDRGGRGGGRGGSTNRGGFGDFKGKKMTF